MIVPESRDWNSEASLQGLCLPKSTEPDAGLLPLVKSGINVDAKNTVVLMISILKIKGKNRDANTHRIYIILITSSLT